MRTFIIKPGDLIPIGRAGENQATQVRFDVTGWADTFGAGQFELIMQRPGDAELPYPVEVTVDGDYVDWTVSNVDTGIAGNCKVQLRYVVSDAVAKSVIYRGIVGESLDHVVDPPDPYDDLIERLEELARQTAQNAEAAARSAGNASDSADAAGRSAGNAADSATEAGRSANGAAQSATDANAAKLAAQAAQQHAEAAQAESEAIEARIMDTVPDAVTDWLDEHITQETGYVIDDSLTVQGAAADAKAVGDALIDKAGVITDTASGAIASFPDGSAAPIKQLTVAVNPVQDLHGYDNPWPAGGGKNKFGGADGTYAIGTTRTITVTDGVWSYKVNSAASSSIFVPNAVILDMGVKPLQAGTYVFSLASNAAASSVIASAVLNLSDGQAISNGSSFTVNAETSIVDITTGTTGQYSVGTYTCQIQIESGTTATAWTPYSNVCPITGWTGATVTRTGKNLLGGIEFAQRFSGVHGYSLNTETKTFTYDRGGTTPALVPTIKYKENTRYTFMVTYTGNRNTSLRISYTDGTYTGTDFATATEKTTYVVTTLANKTVDTIKITWSVTGLITAYYDECGIFEGVLTATDFAPYAGTSYPITWQSEAGTVYGGTLTVEQDGTGTLVVDRAEVDLGTLEWAVSYSYSKFYASVSGIRPYASGRPANILCSAYTYIGGVGISSRNMPDKALAQRSNGSSQILVRDTAYSTAADFKSAMNGVQMVYELATPVTYTLTAAEMTTLFGQNNWWSNTGDVEVEYRADTKLYIDNGSNWIPTALSNIIASSETDWIANRNYTAKELVIVNNRLYKVTANIASGGAITVGTNVTAITLSDIIKTLI